MQNREPLYQTDAYMRDAPAVVTAVTDDGLVIVDQPLFYPTGGGQPGDAGFLKWSDGAMDIETTLKKDGEVAIVPANGAAPPAVGTQVQQVLDWQRRWGHMRVHTALHLLSVAVPLPVTGGSISAAKGRLDFDMPDAEVDKEALNATLNDLVSRDLPVSETWITDAELEAQPNLVKTMSVAPPRGAGKVRLVRIGEGETQVDLQPCGGTHVKSTAEIGSLRIGKTEKKGRQNRRIYLHIDA